MEKSFSRRVGAKGQQHLLQQTQANPSVYFRCEIPKLNSHKSQIKISNLHKQSFNQFDYYLVEIPSSSSQQTQMGKRKKLFHVHLPLTLLTKQFFLKFPVGKGPNFSTKYPAVLSAAVKYQDSIFTSTFS